MKIREWNAVLLLTGIWLGTTDFNQRIVLASAIEQTIQAVQKSWRKLDGQNQLPKVIEGIKFTDGIEAARDHAAA